MESSHQLPLITEIAIDVGILKNKATEQCSCGQTAWKLEQRQHYCNWRCRNCRKTVSVCAGDTDLFSIKVALCSLITRQSRPCGIDHRSTRTLFDNFRKFLTPIMDRRNNTLHLGGMGCGARRDQLSQQNSRRKSCFGSVLWQLPGVEAAKSG